MGLSEAVRNVYGVSEMYMLYRDADSVTTWPPVLAGLQAVQIVTLSRQAVYLTGNGKWNARTVYLVRQAMFHKAIGC